MTALQPSPIHIARQQTEDWPLSQPFVISRGSKRFARVVVVELISGGNTGRGEAVPYARYGQTPEATLATLQEQLPLTRNALQRTLPPNAARNALDCALWDLESKQGQLRCHELAGTKEPAAVETCFTISLDTASAMAEQACAHPMLSLLKLKLGGEDNEDATRMRAIRRARPDARLVADANEAWRPNDLPRLFDAAYEAGLELIEQPLPVGEDSLLASIERPVPICADESAHTAADLEALRNRYDAVNIKLDKAGGLTEALAMKARAQTLGFKIMIGSMVATSLAVAPAMLLTPDADWVDLDGPLLLARDREGGLDIQDGWITPSPPEFWG